MALVIPSGPAGGAFRLVGADGWWSWRAGQCGDLAPGQDEVGLVRVGVVEADQPFAGAADQAGGHVEQGATQNGGTGPTQALVVVEGKQPQPGEQVTGDGHDHAPCLVEREGVAG